MTSKPQDRAIRAALALLHQPGKAGAGSAGEAWRTVEEIGRIGGRLRSALDEAAVFRTLEAPETCGTCGTPATLGTWSSEAGPWTAAATQLVERVEEATTWWTAGSGFCWPAWDESSAAALGTLLCELDALAAALLTAAEHDPAPSPAFPAVDAETETETGAGADGMEPEVRRQGRRRGPGGRLVPSIGLAAAAVVGVLGGITVAATQVGQTGVPKRAIASEPVPYTLHDGEPSTAAGGRENPGTQQTRRTAAPGTAPQPAAPGGPISPASAVTAPSNADPATASGSPGAPGTAPVTQQGSKTPQPRDGGAPPSIPVAVVADPQQLDNVVSDIRAQAERLQAEQLRELAERMRAAMGLGY